MCGKNNAGGSEVNVRFALSQSLSSKKLCDYPSNDERLLAQSILTMKDMRKSRQRRRRRRRRRDKEMLPCVLQVTYEGSGGQAILSHIDMLSVASKDISVSEMVLLKKDADKVANLLSTSLKGIGLSCSDNESCAPTLSYIVCSDKVQCHTDSLFTIVSL